MKRIFTQTDLLTDHDEHDCIVTYYRPQQSWGKVMFLHVSVILFTGGSVSRPTPKGGGWGVWSGGGSPGPHPGGRFRGLAGEKRSPGPHLGGLKAHIWGVGLRPTPKGVSRPTPWGVYPSMQWGRPTHCRWLLLRAVRILLECILVFQKINSIFLFHSTVFVELPLADRGPVT